MKKNIFIIIIITGIFISLTLLFSKFSKSDKSGDKINPRFDAGINLTLEESEFDFGNISMAKGSVSHIFRIKNNYLKPIKIDKIYTSCMCTTAIFKKDDKKYGPYGMPGHGFTPKINEIIEPNKEAQIEVIFDPKAHGLAGIGRIERVVYIEQENGIISELIIKAFVQP